MLLSVLAAMALASGDGQSAAKPAPAPAKADRKVCRTVDTTGTIMGGTKTCHTKAEWAAIDQANGDRVSAGRDLNGQGANRQGGGGFN